MQNATQIAFYQAGRIVGMTPALANTQPVSPQLKSIATGDGCGRNVLAAGDEVGAVSGDVDEVVVCEVFGGVDVQGGAGGTGSTDGRLWNPPCV